MNWCDKSRIVFSVVVSTILLFCFLWSSEDPRTRIDYWQNNYNELLPEDDPRAGRAHEIFKRVLNAAGKRPGVIPRLFIVRNESAYIPLAFAIPDGGIIISKKVLDICYADEECGDDRLAFILAHEIAHQLKDDFWHMRFFEAVELSKKGEEKPILDSVKVIAKMTDHVLAKELQADEYGIIYASMAGFNTDAIVSGEENFFEYIYTALDPGNIKGFKKDEYHPDPEQRAEVVKARLKQVLDVVELFDLGIMFYQAGEFEKAILLFNDFLRFFPSREVYHNLATCHHQVALENYLKWKRNEEDILFERFKLSLSIDSETRAKKIRVKRSDDPQELYEKNIEKAIEYYRIAISQDPSYKYAYNNLGCALLLHGEVYEAIAMLKKAMKIDSIYSYSLNNLGVAFFLAENEGKALESFNRAISSDPSYDSPNFNLGKIAYEKGDMETSKEYWMAYLGIDMTSTWSDYIRNSLGLEKEGYVSELTLGKVREGVLGVNVGDYDDEIPEEWGEPVREREISIEEEPYKILEYKSGVVTLSQDEKILLLSIPGSYTEKSAQGISIGDSEKDVHRKYGNPTQKLYTPKGESWIFSSNDIAFQLKDGCVVSWLLF
jgi:tetratricopeptide (TPR) repeat protein